VTPDIHQRLQQYYRDHLETKHDVKISNLTNITSGWESDVYAFSLEHGQRSSRVTEKLVLRLYSGESASNKSEHEFHSLKRLHEVGYPVPQVHVLESNLSPLGKPFIIMEKIDGPTMWMKLGSADETTKVKLINQFCELFIRLHQLDWHLFVEEAEQSKYQNPYAFVDEWFGVAQNFLEQYPDSGFRSVVTWLEERREMLPCRTPSPTHNDFHSNNVLLRNGISPIVIDWTGFSVSDARFDLAWTLMLADAYLGSIWRETILGEYEYILGEKVAALDYFIVFACARRLFDVSISLLHGAEKMGMRAEAVAAMRQDKKTHERVHQLLAERTGLRIEWVES